MIQTLLPRYDIAEQDSSALSVFPFNSQSYPNAVDGPETPFVDCYEQVLAAELEGPAKGAPEGAPEGAAYSSEDALADAKRGKIEERLQEQEAEKKLNSKKKQVNIDGENPLPLQSMQAEIAFQPGIAKNIKKNEFNSARPDGLKHIADPKEGRAGIAKKREYMTGLAQGGPSKGKVSEKAQEIKDKKNSAPEQLGVKSEKANKEERDEKLADSANKIKTPVLTRPAKSGREEAIEEAKTGRKNEKTSSPVDAKMAPAKSKAKTEDAKPIRNRRKERLEIAVEDRRSGTRARGAEGAQDVPTDSRALSQTASAEADAAAEADIIVNLSPNAVQNQFASREGAQTGGPMGQSPSFSTALAQELRAQYNGDIVRHASVVLKDGGEGLIRLALRPAELGDVKIRLNIADNKIRANIVVKSEEALKAFESELENLKQAFLDGGFDGASLNLSVASDGRGNQGSYPGGQNQGAEPFYSARLRAKEYEQAMPLALNSEADMPIFERQGLQKVNVLV